MTIVECTEGNIFGGFNARDWKSDRSWQSSNDNFIFTIKNSHNLAPKKLPIKNGALEGTCNDDKCGPVFGGYDICVEHMSNVNCSFFDQQPRSYENDTGLGGKLFVGSTNWKGNSGSFLTKEVEVFEVVRN